MQISEFEKKTLHSQKSLNSSSQMNLSSNYNKFQVTLNNSLQASVSKNQSQHYQILYQPAMKDIQCVSRQQLIYVLKQDMIIYSAEKFQNVNLIKSCIKTNWESFHYKIKLGRLQSTLKILKFNIQSKKLNFHKISQGQFGSIVYLKHNQQQYALKCIKITENQFQKIDSILSEIFMLKIASALQVGPKFYNIFQYDAIIFLDCVQVAMQLCQVNFTKQHIKNELKSKNLYKNMKILHSLSICHKDIKFSNIGYSNTFKKFVFLDFGFSKSLNEQVGYKSLTAFEGTFNYSSEEMKKLFFLRKKNFIDLYYNDLHCLQKVYLELNYSLNNKSIYNVVFLQLPFNKISQQKQQNQQQNYGVICSFYKLKYNLFELNHEKLYQIIKQQCILLHTFKKILFEQKKNTEQTYYKNNFNTLYQFILFKLSQNQQQRINKFDALLHNYILQTPQSKFLINYKQKIQIISNMQQFDIQIQTIWGKQIWMEQIFHYLDNDFVIEYNITELRLKRIFVSKLYKFVFKNQIVQTQLYSKMYNKLMFSFFNYFAKNIEYNIQIVEKIHCYFFLFNDDNKRQIVQMEILKYYEKCSPLLYFNKNYEFFIVNRLINYKIVTLSNINYNNNIYNFYQKIEFKNTTVKKQQQIKVIQLYKNAFKIMNLLDYQIQNYLQNGKMYQLNNAFQIFINILQDFKLNKFLIEVTKKILYFKIKNAIYYPELIKLAQQNICNENSQFIKIFVVKCQRLNNLIVDYSSKNQIEQFYFFSKYFFPLDTLQIQLYFKKQFQLFVFCFEQIYISHNFGLHQHLLKIIIDTLQPNNSSKFIVYYYGQIQHLQIKSYEQVSVIYRSFFNILYILSQDPKISSSGYFEQLKLYLVKCAKHFIQITQNLSQNANTNCSIINKDYQRQFFEQKLTQLKGIIKIIQLKYQNALSILLKIPFKCNIGSFLVCQIFDFVNIQCKLKIAEKIQLLYEQQSCKKKQNSLQSNQFLLDFGFVITLIKCKSLNNQEEQIFSIVLNFLNNGRINNIYQTHGQISILCFILNQAIKPLSRQKYIQHYTSYFDFMFLNFTFDTLNQNFSLLIFFIIMFYIGFQFLRKIELQKKTIKIQRFFKLSIFCLSQINNFGLLYLKRFFTSKIIDNFNKVTKKMSLLNIFKYKQRQHMNKQLRQLTLKLKLTKSYQNKLHTKIINSLIYKIQALESRRDYFLKIQYEDKCKKFKY